MDCDDGVIGADSAGCDVAAHLFKRTNHVALILTTGQSEVHPDSFAPMKWRRLRD